MTRYLDMKLFAGTLRWRSLIGVMLIGMAGCGLSDYEKRMDKERERIDEFDKTEKTLEDPLDMATIQTTPAKTKEEPNPVAKVEPAWPFEFYLRLPKGFGHSVKEKNKTFSYGSFPIFRYAGNEAAYNYFVVAALSDDKENFREQKYPPELFKIYVQEAIKKFYKMTYGGELEIPPTEDLLTIRDSKGKIASPVKKHEVKIFTPFTPKPGEDEKTIVYDQITYSDKNNKKKKEYVQFQAFFFELKYPLDQVKADKEKGKLVCIVAHLPLQALEDAAFVKMRDACLGTLDLKDAARKKTEYLKAKKNS
jgi:hypothetical protein